MTLSRQRQHALDHIAPIANKKNHNKFHCISISFWLWRHCHRRHHHHVLQIRTVIVQKHIMIVMTCFAVYTYNLLPFYGSNLMKCRIHGKKSTSTIQAIFSILAKVIVFVEAKKKQTDIDIDRKTDWK